MSQHIFRTATETGLAVTVIIGYDRILNYVFCIVMDQDQALVYSNLCDGKAGTGQQDVNYYWPLLRKLGITVPEQVFNEVETDQRLRTGNRVVHHTVEQKETGIRRLIETRSAPSDIETMDLLAVIGDEAAHEPNYCTCSYWSWEEETARPRLEKLGYSKIRFSMGDRDSFGPLTRIVTASKGGAIHRFIYG